MTEINNIRNALGAALINDHAGVVSFDDAKLIKDTLVQDIKQSDNPKETFRDDMDVINHAKAFLGDNKQAAKILRTAKQIGHNAVTARLEALSGTKQLPVDLAVAFSDQLLGYFEKKQGGKAEFTNVQGNKQDGYSFHVKTPSIAQQAFGIQYKGTWMVSPVNFTQRQLDKVTKKAQETYDTFRLDYDPEGEYGFDDVKVQPELIDWGRQDRVRINFSHGAPEGGLIADYNMETKKFSVYCEQM